MSKVDEYIHLLAFICTMKRVGLNVAADPVVLIGAMAKNTDISKEIRLDVVKSCVPEKFLELNLKAFELGYNK